MADTITTSQELKVGLEYFDAVGDKKTTSFTILNPRDGLTEQQIRQEVGTALNNNIFIFHMEDAEQPVTSDNILTASTTNQTINNLDIGWED